MARPLRMEFPGAWYHVMNRGLGRKNIFLTPEDRQSFLDLLAEISQIFKVEIHAFSLLDNHYHLLVHTPQMGLSRAMRHLNGVYTQRHNRAHKTDGPLFRGRYKAILVDSDEYLLELVRYIHLNPVLAGLADRPEKHPWTSHRDYLRDDKTRSWLVTAEVLGRLGRRLNKARKALHEFVASGVSKTFEREMKKATVILGSKGFADWCYRNFGGEKKKDKEIPLTQRDPKAQIKTRDILEIAAMAYGLEGKDLRQSTPGRKNEARLMAIYLVRQLTGQTQKEMARWFKAASPYTIAKAQERFAGEMEKNRRLIKLTNEIRHTILYNVKT